MKSKIVEYYIALNEEISNTRYNIEEEYRISGYCNRTLELESKLVGLLKAKDILKEVFKDVKAKKEN